MSHVYTQVTGDGFSILERAVLEHNLIAIGKIYDNIYFEQLGALLGTDESRAERVVARMISEDLLSAVIDQRGERWMGRAGPAQLSRKLF